MLATDQTRTAATELAYLRRAADLLKTISTHVGTAPEAVSARDAADWLYANRRKWTAATFRQYRSALAFHFSGQGSDAENVIRSTRHAPGECVRPKKGSTSSRKKKYIPQKHARKLVGTLRDSENRWDKLAADVFEATIHTGLRPIEWNDARLDGTTLVVRNAKATNGRGTGPERQIALTPEIAAQVRQLIARLVAAQQRNEPWHLHVRMAIYNARLELWKDRRYALYTARHQFSANMKSRHPQREVANLMGHRVERTAEKHYGKRRSAWKAVSGVAALA